MSDSQVPRYPALKAQVKSSNSSFFLGGGVNRVLKTTQLLIELHAGNSKLMNTSQIMDQWQTFFDHPGGGQLGLIVAMLDIGSIASFWMVPFFADNYGRRTPLVIGNVIEITGALLSAFANGHGSQYS